VNFFNIKKNYLNFFLSFYSLFSIFVPIAKALPPLVDGATKNLREAIPIAG